MHSMVSDNSTEKFGEGFTASGFPRNAAAKAGVLEQVKGDREPRACQTSCHAKIAGCELSAIDRP